MLQDFIKKLLLQNFSHTPTPHQENALSAIAAFLQSEQDIFLLTGYAGTGKTSLIQSLVHTLESQKIQYALLAPTGRAAKVLQLYTSRPAFTIHKKIYRQKSAGGFSRFSIQYNSMKRGVFIIDEASMIAHETQSNSAFGSGNLLDDIVEFVFTNPHCKLIFLGDTAQLPPIGYTKSYSLDADFLSKSYLKSVSAAQLSQVVRQDSLSGIIENATQLRNDIAQEKSTGEFPKLIQTPDVVAINGAELIEHIERSYNTVGEEETIIITRSNAYANKYNQGIRAQILWKESILAAGDYIMIVKNNYFWTKNLENIEFLANGDIVKVKKIIRYESLYNMDFATILIECIDYNNIELEVKVILQTIQSESPSLTSDENQAFFNEVMKDYEHLNTKKQKYEALRENEYFQALHIKFAYAVTCHKSQGGQWKHIYIDHGYLTDDMVQDDFRKWLYTAITRASEKVHLVNFNKKFFE